MLITDAMDMAAVLEQFGATEAARRAVSAGADVLLMPADVPATIDAVVTGVEQGRFTVQRIECVRTSTSRAEASPRFGSSATRESRYRS